MIQSFSSKSLEKLFVEGIASGIPPEYQRKIMARLEVIDSAQTVNEIRLPGYNLHELKGDRKGTWAVKVSGNWRITFKFHEHHASDVDLEDYH
jgi:toxin HigB-1